MKDYFILTYNTETTDIEQVQNIFKQVQDMLKPTQKLICLPDTLSLNSYTRKELEEFLVKYQKTIEGLFNE